MMLARALALGGRPQEALSRLSAVANLDQPSQWGHDVLDIYVTANAALGHPDAIRLKLNPMPDLATTRKVTDSYMQTGNAQQAFETYHAFLLRHPDALDRSADLIDYAVMAYMSGNTAQAAGLLKAHAGLWEDSNWAPFLSTLVGDGSSSGRTPEDAVTALRRQTDQLLTLGASLAQKPGR